MSTYRPAYCRIEDVTKRLYSGQGTGVGVNADPGRDSLIFDIINSISRRFDSETGRPPGGFAPLYDVRTYSGRGSQMIDADEFATITGIAQNTTPGRAPTWVDITAELTAQTIVTKPVRFWPKTELWRMNVFYVDPYQTGNVRLTGLFGAVQPDLSQTPPTAPWQGLLTQGAVNALSPDGLGGGWWITPEDITKACAEWSVYTFKAGQAGYGDTAGNPSGGPLTYRKGIPPEVNMVIEAYSGRRLKLAMIGLDGTDISEEDVYQVGTGSPDFSSRWAGWQTY